MTIKWAHNAKTGEVFSYRITGEYTDFPRGEWLVYQDYITTGLKSRQAALEWAKEWHACPKCKAVRNGSAGDPCPFCGTLLIELEEAL